MFLTQYVRPEDATGRVADVYGMFPPGAPIPEPLQMLSASPDLLERQAGIVRYFIMHDKFDFGFLGMLRYLVARQHDYRFCETYNDGLLRRAGGLTDEDMAALDKGPEHAPLEEEQRGLLCFAYKVATDPGAVGEADVAAVRALGWSDQDIFEAAYHGTSMVGIGMLYRALRK